jgi:hypothetical protein
VDDVRNRDQSEEFLLLTRNNFLPEVTNGGHEGS